MIIKLTLKDADGVHDSIIEAATTEANKATGLTEDEWDDLRDTKQQKIEELLENWVSDGEYVTVEINTKTKETKVVPVNH